MRSRTFLTILLIGILCLTLGWFARGIYAEKTELDFRNRAMLYLTTESAGAIFAKLGEFGVTHENVKFVHAGTGVQVQIEVEDDRAMEIAKSLQPLVPDLGPTMVTFLVVGNQGGGIIIYKDRVFDTRPIVSEMLKQLNKGTKKPEANNP